MNIFEAFEKNELAGILARVHKSELSEGKKTARGLAKSAKNNKQITEDDNPELIRLIREAILKNDIFCGLSYPNSVHTIMVNQYDQGDFYGLHSDAATQSGQRGDLSFTIFLSSPDEYVGGELVLRSAVGEISIKLKQNQGVLYPTSLLHEVTPVVEGSRKAIVGWVRSRVPDVTKRNLLIELDKVRVGYRDACRDKDLALMLLKVTNDLKRMWLES